ncbi:AraC family transcriptional regulator [Arenicella sp. 4NH20-0111]|uniref:AraC family transcriptional regulator n=1 Tax=Arenicella sp. 4NH20-0111 TaxID=3127648 RepID=UPI003108D95C
MNTEYKKRIERVIRFIEDNLHQRISLSDVASVSHFSVYHFHRIFTAIVGETVNDYIVRRRLERAVNHLVFHRELSITQIALDLGYSSSANFSKAIKGHFGFSPSEIRNPDKAKNSKIGKVSSKYGKVFTPSDLYPARITDNVINNNNSQDRKMNIKVRELGSQRVCTLASNGGYAPDAIYAAWDKLIEWASNNGIPEHNQTRFALAYDNPTVTPVDKCRYVASIVVADEIQINSPFTSFEIPAGKYAVLYFKGDPEEAINAQLSIYSDWLPNSGFEPDDFPMLENYLNDARVDGFLEMEIHVKLKGM